jgi:hypothetical protein
MPPFYGFVRPPAGDVSRHIGWHAKCYNPATPFQHIATQSSNQRAPIMHWLLLAQPQPNDIDAGGLALGGGCMLVWLVLVLAALAVWIWALVDAIKNPALSSNERLIWILVIILTNWLGAIIYLIIGRKKTAT